MSTDPSYLQRLERSRRRYLQFGDWLESVKQEDAARSNTPQESPTLSWGRDSRAFRANEVGNGELIQRFAFDRFLDEKVKRYGISSESRIDLWINALNVLSSIRAQQVQVKDWHGDLDSDYLGRKFGCTLTSETFQAIKSAWKNNHNLFLFNICHFDEDQLSALQGLCDDLPKVHAEYKAGNSPATTEVLYRVSIDPDLRLSLERASKISADIREYLSSDEHDLPGGLRLKRSSPGTLFGQHAELEDTGPSELDASSYAIPELHARSAIIHEKDGTGLSSAAAFTTPPNSLATSSATTAQLQIAANLAILHPGLPELPEEREPAELEAEEVVRGELEGDYIVATEGLYSGPDESTYDTSKKPSSFGSRAKDAFKRAFGKSGSSSGA